MCSISSVCSIYVFLFFFYFFFVYMYLFFVFQICMILFILHYDHYFCVLFDFFFFFFKQKTAYELRISDWSSDVCSSDLLVADLRPHVFLAADFRPFAKRRRDGLDGRVLSRLVLGGIRQVDQHIGRLAELLQRHIAESEVAQPVAQLAEVGRLRQARLEQQAAPKVDAEVQPLHDRYGNRGHRDQRRDGEENISLADKVEAGTERELADQRPGLPLLDRKGLRPQAAQPEDDADARDHDGREHRRDKAERQRDGQALDGTGAERK